MALVIKRRKKKKMNIFTGPELDLEGIIKDCIRSTIMSMLCLTRESKLRDIRYFSTYTVCEHTNDKTLSSVHMKKRSDLNYMRISAREIEITGASCGEFVDFLEEVGAMQISKPSSVERILEMI
jgi:hypothetical protein